MSLDVRLVKTKVVFDYNITHNLNKMAMEVKIGEHSLYEYLWSPEKVNINTAGDLIIPLREGLKELENNPDKYRKFDAENGWGTYPDLVTFVQSYLDACDWYPECEIYISK
jgi:hypothetical protein